MSCRKRLEEFFYGDSYKRKDFTLDCNEITLSSGCLGLGFVVLLADYLRTTALSLSIASAFILDRFAP